MLMTDSHPHPTGAPDQAAPAAPEAAGKPPRRKFNITVYEAWCKRCGICVAFCPAGALRAHETTQQVLTNQAKCTGCRQCEWRCPDFAIVIRPAGQKPAAPAAPAGKAEGKE